MDKKKEPQTHHTMAHQYEGDILAFVLDNCIINVLQGSFIAMHIYLVANNSKKERKKIITPGCCQTVSTSFLFRPIHVDRNHNIQCLGTQRMRTTCRICQCVHQSHESCCMYLMREFIYRCMYLAFLH